MNWWDELVRLLSWLLPKNRKPVPYFNSTFEDQAIRRAKKHGRWCNQHQLAFRTSSEFHDHCAVMHYGSWSSAGSRRGS